jgi:hypothetical protein
MTTATLIDICAEPGAGLDIGVCRFTPDQAQTNLHFLVLLGEVCGRLAPDAAGGFSDCGTAESGWLRLSEVDASALEAIVRRMQRSYPSWRVNGGKGVGVHERVSVHWATAQAAWLRERGRWQ